MNDQIARWTHRTCQVCRGHLQAVSERLQGSDHEVELDTRFPGLNQRNPLTGYAGGLCQLILRPASASSPFPKQAGYVVRAPEQHYDLPYDHVRCHTIVVPTNVVNSHGAYGRSHANCTPPEAEGGAPCPQRPTLFTALPVSPLSDNRLSPRRSSRPSAAGTPGRQASPRLPHGSGRPARPARPATARSG
jgi:hypothetical protein